MLSDWFLQACNSMYYLVRPVKIGAYLHTCLRKEILIFKASHDHKALYT